VLLRDALRDMIEVLVDDQVQELGALQAVFQSRFRFVFVQALNCLRSFAQTFKIEVTLDPVVSRHSNRIRNQPQASRIRGFSKLLFFAHQPGLTAGPQVSVSAPGLERFGVGANKCSARRFAAPFALNFLTGFSPAEATIFTASAQRCGSTRSLFSTAPLASARAALLPCL
jgi:hypothetical protein